MSWSSKWCNDVHVCLYKVYGGMFNCLNNCFKLHEQRKKRVFKQNTITKNLNGFPDPNWKKIIPPAPHHLHDHHSVVTRRTEHGGIADLQLHIQSTGFQLNMSKTLYTSPTACYIIYLQHVFTYMTVIDIHGQVSPEILTHRILPNLRAWSLSGATAIFTAPVRGYQNILYTRTY